MLGFTWSMYDMAGVTHAALLCTGKYNVQGIAGNILQTKHWENYGRGLKEGLGQRAWEGGGEGRGRGREGGGEGKRVSCYQS